MKTIDLLYLIGDTDEQIIKTAKTTKLKSVFILKGKIAVACTCVMAILGSATIVFAFTSHYSAEVIEKYRLENEITKELYCFDEDNIDSIDLFIDSENEETIVNVIVICKNCEIDEYTVLEMQQYIASELKINISNIYIKCTLMND